MAERVEIRVQDYRDLVGERFDAISSIGMFEHVGMAKMGQYFETLREPARRPSVGCSTTPSPRRVAPRSGATRSWAATSSPTASCSTWASVVLAMQRAGFEVRDVESLREHYSRTLHALGGQPGGALGRGGRPWWAWPGPESGGSTWRHRPTGSTTADLAIHQVLGVVPDPQGRSGMPRTRTGWG